MTERASSARPPYAGTRYPRLAEIPAFTEWIAAGWEASTPSPDLAPGAPAASADHRRRLSDAFPARTIVAAAGTAPTRNDDSAYGLRADSSFVWLTACQVEDAVLVMTPRPGGHDAVLFLPAPFRPGDDGFFANAAHGELWVGPSAGLAEWAEVLGIDVRDRAELDAFLDGAIDVVATRAAAQFGAWAGAHCVDLERVLSNLRMIKDDWEIGQLRQTIDATVEGFAATVAEIPRAIAERLGERWLQGTFDRHARTWGNGPGYSTIVGAGAHAPTLHWVRCDGQISPDEVLLLDMGVEARTLYTADVTRTVPAGGEFSPEQRAVHDLVERAHRAGLDRIRPGVEYLDFHFAAMEVIARGLHDWGLLPVSVDEALSPAGQHHRRYLACGIGHHLGLDVHDCSQSHYEDYMGAALEPGVVMTVEPGLYFHAHDLTLPPELRGIGVRLEDDVLVTPTGSDVLSDALPIDARGIERWTKELIT